MALSLDDLEEVFAAHGNLGYAGEPVTQLEHALQAATLAEAAGATAALITATLLHDLGHMLNLQGDTPTARGIDDTHQYFAIPFLRGTFGDAVLEPIRLHVEAKRALCALESGYYDALSEDSRRSLVLQGGVHARAEAQAFVATAYASDAMRLRRWDDAAKVAGALTPPLAHFMQIARRAAASA
ncbi:MAG: phosphonate degradation HD-domain oxygenase [Casimicrobiaceae bacterium]